MATIFTLWAWAQLIAGCALWIGQGCAEIAAERKA